MELKVPTVESWRCHPGTMMRDSSAGGGDPQSPGESHVRLAGFNSASDHDWCELLRDVVALANSGGGVITIACPAGDSPSDLACPRTIDMAASDIVHRLANYTDGSFANVEVQAVDRKAVEVMVGPAEVPIAFTRPGTYADPEDPTESHQAFPAGTFYFRHDGASEPGDSRDMRSVLERHLRQVRKTWLRGIQRVLALPGERGHLRRARRAEQRAEVRTQTRLQPVRIVDDPSAPVLQPQDVDRLYPWRQKDLVRELNARLGRRALNSYDIQAVRRQHRLDERPDFVFHLEGAGRRYSPAVADWIMDQNRHDPDFFLHARAADHEMLRLRRDKPH
jgi:hypothetical protein